MPGPRSSNLRGFARRWPNSRVRYLRIAILVVSVDVHRQSVDCSDDGTGHLPVGAARLIPGAHPPPSACSLIPLCKCLRRCMCHQMPTRCAAVVGGLTPHNALQPRSVQGIEICSSCTCPRYRFQSCPCQLVSCASWYRVLCLLSGHLSIVTVKVVVALTVHVV